MKDFGGKALFLDRNDINTDEIIPAKYLTENTKMALQPFVLEDLKLGGFNPGTDIQDKGAIVTRANFGCGSSREHAVWVFEVNDINIVIAESFARIFRQNMYNCGMLAVELSKKDINAITALGDDVDISVDLTKSEIIAKGDKEAKFSFSINDFEKKLIETGGWLTYADNNY